VPGAREHMFVDVNDRGTWRQDAEGRVYLRSKEHFRDAEVGRLSVFLWYDASGEQRTRVATALRGFLESRADEAFTPAAGSGAHNDRGYTSPQGDGHSLCLVSEVPRLPRTPRGNNRFPWHLQHVRGLSELAGHADSRGQSFPSGDGSGSAGDAPGSPGGPDRRRSAAGRATCGEAGGAVSRRSPLWT